MAQTFREYNAPATYQFTFPSYQSSDVKVRVDGVLKTAGTHYNITGYTTNGGGTVVFIDNSGSGGANHVPSSGVVRIYRDTNVDAAKAEFTPGSSVKAADLNNNTTQLLYRAQEEQVPNLIQSYDINADAIETSNIKNDAVTMAKLGSGALPTDITVASANIVNGTIVNDDINTSAAIAGTKISPDFGSQNIATTGTVDGRDVSADGTKLDTIETNAKDDQTAAEIRTLVESASDSNVFTDADHSKLNQIEPNATQDQTAAEIRTLVESASDSNVFTDADHSKLNNIEAGATTDQTASEIKTLLQSDKITDSEIATGTLDNRYFTETELTNGALDGRYFTETESDARYFNISSGETIKDGDTFPDNDTTIATTAAINDRIIDLVDDVGGFVPIANETSFPTSNPDVNDGAGTIVSVSAASTNLVPSGTTVTIANGRGSGLQVLITGVTATIPSGFGFLVETTTTDHTYAFHRLSPKATEVTTVAGKATQVQTVHDNITQVQTVHNNITNINAVANDAADIGVVAGKETEIGLLGNAATINDLAILGTADVVSDLNTLGTADVVADLNTLGTADVVADMNTLATTSNVNNMDTVATNINNVNNVGNSIASVNTAASNLTSINNFGDKYQVASSNPSTDGGGNALAAGDLYFNTSANELKVYTGSQWQGGVTATGNFAAVTGNTFTGDNIYNDNVKAKFGTGSDLQIYHHGTNNSSFIDNTTGDLNIRGGGGDIILNPVNTETAIYAIANGKVQLRYDNSTKLETTSTGIDVTGRIFGDTMSLGGTGTGSGALFQFSNNTAYSATGTNAEVAIGNANSSAATNSTGIHMFTDGNGRGVVNLNACNNSTNASADFVVQTRHAGTLGERLRINSGGNIDIPADNAKLRLGASQDLQLYHTGSANHIDSVNGALAIRSDVFQISTLDGTHVYLNIPTDEQGVQLYYDGSKKLETTSSGVSVTGNITTTGQLFSSYATLTAVNPTLTFSDSNNDPDYTINVNSGVLKITDSTNSADRLVVNSDGNIQIPADNKKLQIGASQDLEIFHNGSASVIKDNGTGNLQIAGSTIQLTNAAIDENLLIASPNGSIKLLYDNAEKLETTSAGISVTGTSTFGGSLIMGADNSYDIGSGAARVRNMFMYQTLDFLDTGKIQMGNSDDLQIYHDGSNSAIQNATGTLFLYGGSNRIRIRPENGENSIVAIPNGAAELYYDNSKKLETSSTGVDVTGEVRSTGNMRIQSAYPRFYLTDTDNNDDYSLINNNGQFVVYNDTANASRIKVEGNNTFFTTDLRATTDSSFDIGTSTHRWNAVYADNYYGDGSNLTGISSVGGATGVDFNDNVTVKFGTHDDLSIFHNGNHSYIAEVGTGDLRITGSAIHLQNAAQSENILRTFENGTVELYFDNSRKFMTESTGVKAFGIIVPSATNTHDLGTSTLRWRNVYTNDLNLSNEGSSNDVDGTWGDYTIQEGESDLFLKNNRSGKKYRFNLTEVS